MGMHIANGSGSGEPEVMTEMNTTPLIDVMLVLLIMLILTIPVQLHSVNLNMPVSQPPTQPKAEPPPVVTIDIDAAGQLAWNGEPLRTHGELEQRLYGAVAAATQPEVHIKPHKAVAYREVAAVLASAQRLGVAKLGVVGNEQFLP